MANILTPEWKIEIGTNTYEMQAVSRISHTTIVLDETGVFTLVIDNAAGIRKSAFTPYDEVKISHKYEEDTAYTQIIGGHVDTQEYTVTDSGDIITLTGRSYEAQFFFKQVYKTWMFEHWATIIEDIVTEVNVNVTDNFTTSLPAAVEQTTGGTDTVDIDDLYNGTEVVGQVIKPNEGYLSTVVVKGYKSSGTVDDLECRVYRCKDNGGTDTNTLANVDWAQTIGGTLLGISTVPPGIITDDSDNPQEISFQVDTPSLDTDNLYMLVFAKATTDDGTGYYLRYNTSGGYADGDYFADGTRITDDDIYFKLNALCVKAEDRTAFDLMREVCGTVLRDWYSTTAKVVTTVERYGTSVKTFTVGKDIISCSIKTDIIPLVNKIVVAGIPKTSNIPTDRDEWTESTTDWEVAYDEESGNTDITTAYPIRKIGEECITIERGINYEANSVCRVEYPDDADEWALADGLDQRVKALS